MELLQLRYFLESAKTASFAKTAEKFRVPASSVSASIRRLEQELGKKLFTRTANRVMLNENGIRLQTAAALALSELDQAVNDIKNPPDKRVIHLLVLAYRRPITSMIIEYQQKHPSVAFEVCIDHHITDYDSYDIIIGAPGPQFANYADFQLRYSRVAMVVPKSHPLYGKTVTLAQIQGYSIVTMSGIMNDAICNAFQNAGLTPNITAMVNDARCYSKLLHSGDVIGHRRDVGDSPAAGFAYLNVKDFHAPQPIHVFYKESAAVGNIKHFLEFLKSKAE